MEAWLFFIPNADFFSLYILYFPLPDVVCLIFIASGSVDVICIELASGISRIQMKLCQPGLKFSKKKETEAHADRSRKHRVI